MKKFGCLLMVLLMTIVLASGCSTKDSTSDTEQSDAIKSGENNVKDDDKNVETIVIQAGTTVAESSVYAQLLYKLDEFCQEKSNGSLKIEVYLNSQLGSQAQLIEQMQAGAPVICNAAALLMSDYGAPDLSILGGPYLFESWDDVNKIVNSDWLAQQHKLLEQNGIHVLSFNMQSGIRATLSTKKMETLADFSGKKIRVPSSTSNVKAYEALGAAATPMNLGEVYTALQTGIVDGEDNGLATMVSEKHYEVAKYLLLDNHMFDMQCLMISNDTFQSLSPENQQILTDAANEAVEWFNKSAVEASEESLQTMEDAGVEISRVTDFSEFKKAAEAYFKDEKLSASWSDGLYQKILNITSE